MNRLAMIAAALGLAAAAASADGIGETRVHAVNRPVVVELFTSQGCSSCPPADAVLAELAKRPDVLALGFHVDYWDRLGWKDPLSSPGATQRQHDYAADFGRNEIYTPQLVVDGRLQLVGSHREAVLKAVDGAARETSASVAFSVDQRSVSIAPGSGRGSVIAVRFVLTRETPVARGENAGHMAQDVNGVEALIKLSDWTGTALTLPVERPEAGHGLAILVQSADGRILGAASIVS